MKPDAHGALDDLFGPVAAGRGPGLVVGIASQGRVLFRKGYGLASVQHGVANQPQTRMRIGSTTKHFTALAALLLAEDGLLDLDATIDRYLPALPRLQGFPTLRQLLNHTGGYRCTLEMGTFANGTAEQPPGWQMAALHRQTGVNFAPGQAQMYCNGAYHAVSRIIEAITATKLAAVLAQRIFAPLGMNATELVVSDKALVPGLAALHVPAGPGAWQRAPADSELLGDGGIVSTVDDMLLWLAHLRGPKRVGSAGTWRQMLEPARLANGHVSTYALGLKMERYRGTEAIHHSGAIWGGNCQMLTLPSLQLDVIVMVNSGAPRATDLAWQVVDLLEGDRLAPPTSRPAPSQAYPHLVGACYLDRQGTMVAFSAVDGALGLAVAGMSSPVTLREQDDTLQVGFEIYGQGPMQWRRQDLAQPAGGPLAQIPMRVGGTEDGLYLVSPPTSPDDALARQLVGRYRSQDVTADAEIGSTAPMRLVLRGDYGAPRMFRIVPCTGSVGRLVDEAEPQETFQITLDRGEAGIGGFWVDTFRARRLRFDRLHA